MALPKVWLVYHNHETSKFIENVYVAIYDDLADAVEFVESVQEPEGPGFNFHLRRYKIKEMDFISNASWEEYKRLKVDE
jgi:hypothetical protein